MCMCNVLSYPVLSSRYVAVRERNMLRSRWKIRVELSNGTTIEDAEKKREETGVIGVPGHTAREAYRIYRMDHHFIQDEIRLK